MESEHLAAVCGLYCGACRIYRAWCDNNQDLLQEILKNMSSRGMASSLDDLRCDGCLGGGQLTTFCRQCAIRLCPDDKPDVTRCSDCPDFPCSRISDFNNDGMRHHAEVLDSLRRLQEIGLEAWLKREEKQWRCPQCQAEVDWYARTCFQCGVEQPYRLPTLPRDEK
ncbi:DUF3795 domain-containing protein [Chloroflexota bacterium]